MENDGIVYVGRKPVIKYILACITLFHEGLDRIAIKARGKSIENAINVVESLRKFYMRDVEVYDIKLGSEIVRGINGGPRRVSTITIYLMRKSS